MPGAVTALLDEKLADLEKARAWSPRVISKLEALLTHEDPWALYRMNPFVFAAEKGVGEDEAIDLFLHASKLGLFNLEWHLICPSCSDSVRSFESMTGLHSHFTCNLCRLDNEANLDDYIEVSFSVTRGIRDCPFHHPEALSPEDYCFRYHFHLNAKLPDGSHFAEKLRSYSVGLGYLEPLARTEFTFDAKPGFILGWDFSRDTGLFLTVQGEPSPQPQVLQVSLGKPGYGPDTATVRPGRLTVAVENTLPQRSVLSLGQLGPDHFETRSLPALPAYLTGNRLLNSQTFRNLFRSETMGSNEGVGVRDLTLLFTDLKGSTAMYERIGDLKAFALVQQHFEHLTKAIGAHRGAVVKTIGDAVMASFNSPADATAAALDMLKEIEGFNRSQGHREILLKIGIHRGPSIAVTLNERLDFFGQTVNIAARVQGLADAEEICVTEAVFRAPGVASMLDRLHSRWENASLKGVSGTLPILRAGLAPAVAAKVKKKAKATAKAKGKAKPKAVKKTAKQPKRPAKAAKVKRTKR